MLANIRNKTDYNFEILKSFNDFSLCEMVEAFVKIFTFKKSNFSNSLRFLPLMNSSSFHWKIVRKWQYIMIIIILTIIILKSLIMLDIWLGIIDIGNTRHLEKDR